MRLGRSVLILAGVGLFCVTGMVAANAAYKLSARPTAVAVVDVATVLDEMKEKTQIEADLKTQQEQVQREAERMTNDLKDLKSDLDILARGTPAYSEKLAELDQQVIQMKSWEQYQTLKIQRENARQMLHLYNKISAKAGEVAKENGFDIVLYKDRPIDVEFRDVEPKLLSGLISSRVSQRKILWSSDEIDITDQVVQRMNNEFSNLAQ